MGIHRGPNTVNDGLVFGCDTGYGIADNNTGTRFYPGKPTTNHVANPETMAGWTSYSNGNDGTFITEFGTTGYKIINRASWNGLYKAVNVPSTGTYTFSAWFRYLGGTANNNGATVYVSSYGAGDTATSLDKSKVGEWQRISKTVNFTDTDLNAIFYLISYGGSVGSDTSSWEVTMPQVEAGSGMTPFTSGTRSSTASLIDLKRTTSIDVSNVSFDSTGQPIFDNSDDRITMPNSSVFNHTSQLTIESWVKFDGNSADFIFEKGNVNTQYSLFSHGTDIVFRTIHTGDSGYQTLSPSKTTAGITNGVWHHIVGSWDGSTKRIYVDGVDKASVSKSGVLTTNSNGAAIGSFGGTSDGYYFGGDIAIVRIYDKGLSAAEVKQNYNAYKNRFDS